MKKLTHRQKLGKEGEQLACEHLTAKGLQILARNFRHGRAELDIVAKDGETLVFVEVKTRETEQYGLPENSVGTAKKNKLAEGAQAFLEQNKLELNCRYDIISIIKNQYQTDINHIEDAFWPGLY